MSGYAVTEGAQEGLPTSVLSAAGSELEAAFAPGAGMIGCSLRHRGEELLGQRGGLAKYAESGSSMGIPLLHPWANRLDGLRYSAGGRTVELDPDCHAGAPRPQRPADPRPRDGVAALGGDRARGRQRRSPTLRAPRLVGARGPDGGLSVSPPARGRGAAVRPHADDRDRAAGNRRRAGSGLLRLPPLRLPPRRAAGGVGGRAAAAPPRAARRARDPDRRGASPSTSRRRPSASAPTTTCSSSCATRPSSCCAAAAAASRCASSRAIRCPGLRAPGEDYICFEPMTAPTNALVSGDRLQLVAPGEEYIARFSISVYERRWRSDEEIKPSNRGFPRPAGLVKAGIPVASTTRGAGTFFRSIPRDGPRDGREVGLSLTRPVPQVRRVQMVLHAEQPQAVALRAHNPKVAGSNPAPAMEKAPPACGALCYASLRAGSWASNAHQSRRLSPRAITPFGDGAPAPARATLEAFGDLRRRRQERHKP